MYNYLLIFQKILTKKTICFYQMYLIYWVNFDYFPKLNLPDKCPSNKLNLLYNYIINETHAVGGKIYFTPVY